MIHIRFYFTPYIMGYCILSIAQVSNKSVCKLSF